MTSELRRGIVLAAVGLVAGFVLIGVAASGTRLFSLAGPDAPPSEAVAPPTPAPLAALSAPGGPGMPAAPAKPSTATGAPSFDLIRVEPDGASVVAGRGRPGAEIELLRDGASFARATADADGNFALVPPPLPPGSHEITLRSTAPGGTAVPSRESAVVVVAQDRRTKPLVAVTAPGQPTAVLSLPEPARPTADNAAPAEGAKTANSAEPDGRTARADGSRPAKPQGAGPEAPQSGPVPVKVVGVDAEAGGRLHVTAQGAPRADLRLYLNDTLVAPGKAGPDGRLAFTIGRGVGPGDYRVRIDQVDPASGAVKTRAETAFAVPPNLGPAPAEAPGRGTGQLPAPGVPGRAPAVVGAAAAPPAVVAAMPEAARAPGAEAARGPAEAAPADPGAVFVPGISTAKVTRGDNLWSISRRAYGKGLRYTVIFDANQGQIRDPNRIYPGQVFVLPGEAPQGQRQVPESRG